MNNPYKSPFLDDLVEYDKNTLKEWVFEARKNGFDDIYIKNEMSKKGYSDRLINEMLKEFPCQSKLNRVAIPLGLIILIISFFLIIYVFFSSFYFEVCHDNSCFVEKANSCESVIMEKIISDSKYILSSKNCKFKKIILEMDESEPEEIKNFLESKNMVCFYEKGMFNEDLINTVSLGIGDCEGSLKDALEDISLIV